MNDLARQSPAAPPSALSAEAILALLWGAKWPVIIGTIVGLLGAIAYLHLATPRYQAFLQLVPTEQSGVQVNRNITGLASLAGINLPRGQGSQFAFALETMTGRDVAEAVAKDRALMARLFAGQWDAVRQQWAEPHDSLRATKDAIKRLLAIKVIPWAPPGASDLQRYLQRNLALTENPKRSIATVTLTHPDPETARDLLAAVHRGSDAHLRRRMEARTIAYIAYIRDKLRTVDLAEHREALAVALAEQERLLMMAQTGQPFAADPLGMVSVTDAPVSPNTVLVLAGGIAAGALFGLGAALLLNYRRTGRRAGPEAGLA